LAIRCRQRARSGDNPVGETRVLVEPDLAARAVTYGVMRPWRPVKDTIAYNQGN
jgi:zinc protease